MSNLPTCYVCDKVIEGTPATVENCRTGAVWNSHADCCGPTPDSYAATARMMAGLGGNDGFDWDQWKDEMKDGEF
jgi:hypothetical protein